jgi:hypothetical protein
MITHPGDDCQSVQAVVTLTRVGDGAAHAITVDLPDGRKVPLFLDTILAGGTKAAFIQWADFNLNRPVKPIEELVDDCLQEAFETGLTGQQSTPSGKSIDPPSLDKAKAKLLAALTPPPAIAATVKEVLQALTLDVALNAGAPCGYASDYDDLIKPHQQKLLAAFAQVAADRDHWKSNHDEMVARNKVLRTRPDLPQECGHPKQCIGRVHEEDETEEPHCLWCGDIKDMEMLVRHLTHIYSAITDGRISKPNTLPDEVERVAGDLETERTEAAVKDALEEGYANRLYEDLEEIVPYTGEFEPGNAVTIYWKTIEGEVDGPTVDHGYVFTYPHEDTDVGACVHIPHPDPRGDRDVSPEWPTVAELLSNPLIERIEFEQPPHAERLEVGGRHSALMSVDERYEREVKLIQRLHKLGVIRIQRGLLATEIALADKEIKAA